MKRSRCAIFVLILLIFSVSARTQEKTVDRRLYPRMIEMMQDSTMMNMMMEHIAKNDSMRSMMMRKMMASVKGDQSKMMAMCKTMMQDENMQAKMMKILEGAKQTSTITPLEVLVKFKPDVKEEQINAMATEIGMQQIKVIKELNLRVFRITSGKSLQEVISHCEKEPFVDYAEPNQTYRMQKR